MLVYTCDISLIKELFQWLSAFKIIVGLFIGLYILGIGEGVNVGNVKAFNQIFSLRCIEPLSKKIARVFNDRLFNGIGTFEFLNVLPSDEEEVRQHYLSGGITKNEYRIELGYKPIIGGDVFVDGSKCSIERIKSNFIDYKTIVKRNIKQKFR